MRRKGDDACHTDVLPSFDLDTTLRQRDVAWLRSSSVGSAGVFLTAIPGSSRIFGNDMFVVPVWHRLGHHVPADVAPPPCKCRAGVAAEADHAMFCQKVAKMTQICATITRQTPCAWSSLPANRRRSLATIVCTSCLKSFVLDVTVYQI